MNSKIIVSKRKGTGIPSKSMYDGFQCVCLFTITGLERHICPSLVKDWKYIYVHYLAVMVTSL